MVMLLSTGIVVLYHGGDDPGGFFAEVHDDAQPTVRERVLAIVALAITLRRRKEPAGSIEQITIGRAWDGTPPRTVREARGRCLRERFPQRLDSSQD
jgi:hypothetical protein